MLPNFSYWYLTIYWRDHDLIEIKKDKYDIEEYQRSLGDSKSKIKIRL